MTDRWIRPVRMLSLLALAVFAAPAARGLEPAFDPTLLALPSASASPRPAGSKAIARVWRGRTLTTRANEYEAYLFASGIAKLRRIPGNLGVTVLRRSDGKETEFVVLSVWDSLDAVKRFAGPDYEKTVILDRDREYLIEVEPTVKHYAIEREERQR